jgi:hypothetical protein
LPGKTNDSVAIKKTSLPAWLDSLPPGYFVAADCAHSITEHLIAPYSGAQQFLEKCDNFNFFLIATLYPYWNGIWLASNKVVHSTYPDQCPAEQPKQTIQCNNLATQVLHW